MIRLSVFALALALPCARAGVEFLGEAALPGTASDRSGLKGKTSDGTPADRLGGLGSAIAYTGRGDRYLLASDRGPKDGESDFVCRWHVLEVRVRPGTKQPVRATLVETTLLTDEKGRRLVGSLAGKQQRLDPEGVRVGRRGTVFLADEYGPALSEFGADGARRRTLAVPARFLPEWPAARPADELPPKNRRGRQPNRGMEGLAVTPDGSRLLGAMQSPLIQDGALDAKNERVGVNTRLLEVEVATGRTREFVYPLGAADLGVSEIVAVNARRFLVLERDGKAGTDAKVKRLYLIDTAGATDVSGVEALPAGKLPAAVVPVTKALFLDLLAPRFGLAGRDFPEKVEGLAFGPDLPDGRRLLLVTADNDFVAERPLRVFAFAVGAGDLPGYEAQAFDRPE
ncbi:MAG: esterase-like activity of phytase family protein [Gemmataceae bacterium]